MITWQQTIVIVTALLCGTVITTEIIHKVLK